MFKQEDLLSVLKVDKAKRYFADRHLTLLKGLVLSDELTHPDTLIFLHIPKTGGTNIYFMYQALENQYANLSSVRLSVPYIKGVCSPNKISEGWVGAYDIGQLTLNDSLPSDFISGHFPFGLHQSIKDNTRSIKYIALCRHPIQRTISTVNFDYQRGDLKKEDVLDYLKNEEIDNPQTRILAGIEHMSGPCTEDTLAVAKRNIEQHFLFVAPTEETNLAIQVLATLNGVVPLAIARAQVTGEKLIHKIDEKLSIWLLNKHYLDVQLYQWVQERWLQWKAENIVDEVSLEHSIDSADQAILTIPANYASNRQAQLLTLAELDRINEEQEEAETELVEIVQKNNGLGGPTPLKQSTKTSYSIGNTF